MLRSLSKLQVAEGNRGVEVEKRAESKSDSECILSSRDGGITMVNEEQGHQITLNSNFNGGWALRVPKHKEM